MSYFLSLEMEREKTTFKIYDARDTAQFINGYTKVNNNQGVVLPRFACAPNVQLDFHLFFCASSFCLYLLDLNFILVIYSISFLLVVLLQFNINQLNHRN